MTKRPKKIIVYHKLKLKQNPMYREKKRLYLKEYYRNNKEEILKQQKAKREEVASE